MAKQAALQRTIPPGTKGLLLKIMSVTDSLWMDVRIDNELVASLLVVATGSPAMCKSGRPLQNLWWILNPFGLKDASSLIPYHRPDRCDSYPKQ